MKSIFFAVIALTFFAAKEPAANLAIVKPKIKVKTISWNDFVNAVIYVESKGNDSAYCAKEKAIGCLQIRPIMIDEINRIQNKVNYKHTDAWNRAKSIEIFNTIAKKESYEKIARKWNGGFYGDKKTSTLKYWAKVKKRLKIYE